MKRIKNNFILNKKIIKSKGFSLVETLVAISIFLIVSVAIYSGFTGILKTMTVVRVKGIMTNIANEQFEVVRNLSYQDVGTVLGIPSGIISQSQTINRDGKDFTVETVVRNVDDPFDGTFNGNPHDSSPADMKIIELTISCSSCVDSISPISFTTKIAPKNLETASTNGALIIRVFDSSGVPVSSADINIINNSVNPKINLNDQTDINGILTIVDAPPSKNSYQIIVTKDGYSTDRTYATGVTGNPNPTKPNTSVLLQQITQISFIIDRTSKINIFTLNNQCVATPSFGFSISGSKLIGTPNVYKYLNSFTTDTLGKKTLSSIEWDTYNISGADSVYDIIGTSPLLSLGVNPNIEQDLQIITAPKNGKRLLVVVRDSSTGLPLSDAIVKLTGPNSYSKNIVTNEGFLNQTDWKGGDGQEAFGYFNMYSNSDGNIESIASPGNLSLKKVSGVYSSNGNLTSSIFDTGSSSNFRQIIWNSASQPAQTGPKSVRVQIATSNCINAGDDYPDCTTGTWNFVGPDGTSSTYYDSTNQNINAIHNEKRYFRYKIYLSTLNTSYTPTISDISFTYTSACIPPGQVSFSSLVSGNYTILVTKNGYKSMSKNVSISNDWTKSEIVITP